jgi:hypothetical protein
VSKKTNITSLEEPVLKCIKQQKKKKTFINIICCNLCENKPVAKKDVFREKIMKFHYLQLSIQTFVRHEKNEIVCLEIFDIRNYVSVYSEYTFFFSKKTI